MARFEKKFESATVEWPTPQELFDELHAEFSFTTDVAATDENAKCAHYYTQEQDGLKQDWRGVCWMNPPYGRSMVEWLKKAIRETWNGTTTVCLIPARTNTAWWHEPQPGKRHGLRPIYGQRNHWRSLRQPRQEVCWD